MSAAELRPLLLGAPRWTLAVAESLTCGRVQARIGAVPGASEYFRGGVTAYALEEKVRLLGVDRDVAEKVNCVSAEVAEQMARGACGLFGADFAVATTGYAQPDAARGVAEPFAWIAVARREGETFSTRSARVECAGASRIEAQDRVAEAALMLLVAVLREARGA
ncbi:MAG: hypothetical protein RLZZ15_278 [Verrucomicrobiota bacterium]